MSDCVPGATHFFHGGKCVICDADAPPSRCCATCVRSFEKENGNYCCGAPVDDKALSVDDQSRNPIWAVRKYGRVRMMQMLLNHGAEQYAFGTDCENMSPDDGAECALWELEK